MPFPVSLLPTNATTGVIGANTLVAPLVPIGETGARNPCIGILTFLVSDFAGNTTTTISLYGVTHTYLCTFMEWACLNGSFSAKIAFRYE